MVLPPHPLRQRKQEKINKNKEGKRNFISASPKSRNPLAAMFACGIATPAPYSSPNTAKDVPALDCLPPKDMAVKRNKMSAGVKQP